MCFLFSSFCQIRTNKKAMDELRSTNQALQDRLETMYRSLSLSPQQSGGGAHNLSVPNSGNMSLLNEMELSDSEQSRSLNASRRPFSQIDEEDDAIECDNPEQGGHLSTLEAKEVRLYTHAPILRNCKSSQLFFKTCMMIPSTSKIDLFPFHISNCS